MMLHMQDIISDQKSEGHRCAVSDLTFGFQTLGGNAFHKARKQQIVLKPEIDDVGPWHPRIAMQTNSVVLSV